MAGVLLVIDDNPSDASLLQEAMVEARIDCRFYWVDSGAKAFEFLLQRGAYASMPRVDLILLDINMPGMNGHALHELMRSHPELRDVRVAMWSSSNAHGDRKRAAAAGAIAYLVKATDWEHLVQLAKDVLGLIEQVKSDGEA